MSDKEMTVEGALGCPNDAMYGKHTINCGNAKCPYPDLHPQPPGEAKRRAHEMVAACLYVDGGEDGGECGDNQTTVTAAHAAIDAIPEAGGGHDSHIWCEVCEKATRLILDINDPEVGSAGPTTDLVCGECHLVIATTHAIEPRCQPVPERPTMSREELAATLREALWGAEGDWLRVADFVLARFGGGGKA